MLTSPAVSRCSFAVEPCDMRRSFDGLHNAVTTLLGEEPQRPSANASKNAWTLRQPQRPDSWSRKMLDFDLDPFRRSGWRVTCGGNLSCGEELVRADDFLNRSTWISRTAT